MKKKLLNSMRVLLAAVCLLVGTDAWGQFTTWTFKANTAVWGASGITLSGGNQYDKDASSVLSGGVTFTGTSGFVSTAKGIGFNTTGSTSNENISIVVPAGYKATVSVYTASNRTVIGDFNGTQQTYNASWASSTKEFNNAEGATPVTLYLYCNQNAGGADQKKAPFLESIVLTDMSAVASHSWTANAVATIGGVKTTIKSYSSTSEVAEGSNYYVVVDKVIQYNGDYYELNDAAFTANVFGKQYTMGTTDAVHEIAYTKVENTVFYGEAENIQTNKSNATLVENRTVLSNGGGYYASGGSGYVTLTFNVPSNGLYNIAVGMNNANESSRGFNYSIDGADASETINVAAYSPYVLKISKQLSAGEHTIKLNLTYNLSPIFDYLLVRSIPFAEGKYYLKNKGTGAYFAAGQNWSTQAITNNIGHVVGLEYNSDGTWNINTYVYGTGHYLNGLWCDGAASGWILTDAGEGYYTISSDGTNFITAGTVGAAMTTTTGTGDNTKWQLLTDAEWKAEQVARLSAASYTSGVDATFYLPGANFNRRDNDENAKWQGSPGINGLDQSAGCNFNAEKYSTTPFDVYQSLTGVKPGIYKVTCQGFYRNGTSNDRNALLYANSFETPLVNIKSAGITAQDNAKGFTTENGGFYVPNSQKEAAKAFNNGYYGDNELWFVVGDDGALRIGVKKTTGASSDWALFDNFQLTYYGENITATIGDTGWTTFASPYALNLSSLASATAYYASAVGVESVTMTSTESSAVAAGEGLMLKGTAGATVSIPVVVSGSNIDGNLLVGCTTSTVLGPNPNYYVLVNNGGAEFQSLKDNSATIPAGKAYLDASAAGAKSLKIVFDDETLGISDASMLNSNAEGMGEKAIYNLSGQRIAAPQKGINIIGGRKVVVK